MATRHGWPRITAALTLALCGAWGTAHANEYKVYSPYVVPGENEVEARAFYQQDHNNNDIDQTQVDKLSIGRGITSYWASELYAEFEGSGHHSLHFDSVEWENRFQLTPQNKYWLDLGLLAEAEFPVRSQDPNSIRIGPLLQKQFGRVVATANLFWERQYGADAAPGTDFSYAARVKWLLTPRFDPALEFYGNTGNFSDFAPLDRQSHEMGPALYGTMALAPGTGLRYSAAVLFGTTPAAADATFVARVEYEFF